MKKCFGLEKKTTRQQRKIKAVFKIHLKNCLKIAFKNFRFFGLLWDLLRDAGRLTGIFYITERNNICLLKQIQRNANCLF